MPISVVRNLHPTVNPERANKPKERKRKLFHRPRRLNSYKLPWNCEDMGKSKFC